MRTTRQARLGILEPPNLIFFVDIWHLFSTPYFTQAALHISFIHGFRVRYIQVTRSAEAGTDGLHATVQALTIVRAKCAGAIHLSQWYTHSTCTSQPSRRPTPQSMRRRRDDFWHGR